MITKSELLSALFAILIGQLSGQEVLIDYTEDMEFNWTIFEGVPDPDSDSSASSEVGLTIKIEELNKCQVVTIRAVFDKTESWVKSSSSQGLAHELYHLKISEDVRRLMLKELYSIPMTYQDNKSILEERFNNYVLLEDYRQKAYDKNTNHGLDRERQLHYENLIDQSLDELRDFNKRYLLIHSNDEKKKELLDEFPVHCE